MQSWVSLIHGLLVVGWLAEVVDCDRLSLVGVMNEKHVDLIQVQSLEAFFERAEHSVLTIVLNRSVHWDIVELGWLVKMVNRHEHAADFRRNRKSVSGHYGRGGAVESLALAMAVKRGAVDVRHSELDGRPDGPGGGLVGDFGKETAHRRTPEADPGDFHAG